MQFELVKVRGQLMLFTDLRIKKCDIFKGWHKYEVRESDEGQMPCEISEHIFVNFHGTLLSPTPFTKWDESCNGRNFAYLQFSDKPYLEKDEYGGTHEYYEPLESEWSYVVDCENYITEEFLQLARDYGII